MELVDELSHDFWRQSCQFYAQPPHQKMLLEGQHKYNWQINRILFCCWLGSTLGAGVSHQLAQVIDTNCRTLERVISDHRAVRYLIGKDRDRQSSFAKLDQLYALAKRLELRLEKCHQSQLVESFFIATPDTGKNRWFSIHSAKICETISESCEKLGQKSVPELMNLIVLWQSFSKNIASQSLTKERVL